MWPATTLEFSPDHNYEESERTRARNTAYFRNRLHVAPDASAGGSTRKRRSDGIDGMAGGLRGKRQQTAAARIALLTSQLRQQTQRADKAERRADNEAELKQKARRERSQAQQRADKAEKRSERFEKKATGLASTVEDLSQKLREAERTNKRCVVDAKGVRHPLHEIELAQPKQGEVNVSPASQGRRIAVDWMCENKAGSLKVRGNKGGVEYTITEQVHAMATDLEEGIGPRHNRALRETNNMMRRARGEGCSVEVVLPPRPGCRIRQKGPKGPVNPFPRPSASSMRLKIRPTFRLLMHLEAARLLKNATSINIVCDGKEFGPKHTLGVVVCLYFRDRESERKDLFGNTIPVYQVWRVPMCLQQAPNKLHRT